MKKLSLFILLTFGLFLSQCKKEEAHNWNDPVIPGGNYGTNYTIDKGGAMTIDAFGVIQNEQGNPLPGVTVTLGSKTYTSDQHGQVKISQGSAYANIAYLKAEMAGYFTGSRSFIPTSGVNHFAIRLMSKDGPQAFQASKGATLTKDDAEVVLGNSYVDASGNAYTGTVSAFIRHLDPEDPNILGIMPGALRGADASGEKVLETFGMIAVELEGVAGEKLQPAKDHPATIKAKVPASLLSKAPATIPLWHFNEVSGIWSHDGEAKLENGSYVGKVSHFSMWNYDLPNSVARIIGKVIGDDGLPIPGVFVDYCNANPGGSHSGGMADDHGNFVAQLPLNTDLILKIYLNGQIIYTESFNSGSNIEIIKEYKMPMLAFATVTGIVLGCNGIPLPTGCVIVDRFATAPVVDGKFSFKSVIQPGKSIQLMAAYLNGGNSKTWTVAVDQDKITVPAFNLCPNNGSTDDFEFSFTIDGMNHQIQGVKTVVQTDSMVHFIGGRSALDYNTDQDFSFMFFKGNNWDTKSQFKFGDGSGNGYMTIELGNNRLMVASDIDINVISKSPFNIEFSGRYMYYDHGSMSYVYGPMTKGKIIEK